MSQVRDIFPKIVPAGRESAIAISPVNDGAYQVTLVPTEVGETRRREACPINGVLRILFVFEGEQEYVLLLETSAGDLITEFRLYALDDDLFACRPFKGDMHVHSSCSDGKEPPAYVIGACRRIGLDFAAVTDHRQYAPSLEAIRAFESLDIDLRIYPGEEIHPPDNPVHIVNFGGRFSMNELFGNGDRHIFPASENVSVPISVPISESIFQSCARCFDKIREAGGLGIFCHPYWFTNHRYDVPVSVTDLILDRQPYDALEIIGGYHKFEVESNTLQVARYHEERSKGRRIPIVGVSDAHGCETGQLFGWYYTVVFAPSPDLPDLIGAIKDLRSVAVEALPGEAIRAYGPFRLVKFTQYLFREVFPVHDALCEEEGRLMLAHIAGDASAAELLGGLKGRTSVLYDRLWGAA